MQVGDAPPGVDHRQGGSLSQGGLDPGADLLSSREVSQTREDRTQAVVGGQARSGQGSAVAFQDGADEGPHDVAEDDRVGDLHHGRLQVHGEQQALPFGSLHLLGQELVECRRAHDGGVHDLPGQGLQAVPQDGDGAVTGDVADGEHVATGQYHRLLVVAEVAGGHGGDAGT